jgi:hypothetical protein
VIAELAATSLADWHPHREVFSEPMSDRVGLFRRLRLRARVNRLCHFTLKRTARANLAATSHLVTRQPEAPSYIRDQQRDFPRSCLT